RTIPPEHPGYAMCQVEAAMALQVRFERTGDPADLDAAITLHEAAAASAGRQVSFGIPLGAALRQRFQLKGSRQDLQAAITITEATVRDSRRGDLALA